MGSLHIDPVTAVLGLLLALLCGAVLFVYRTVKSLAPMTKASFTQAVCLSCRCNSTGCAQTI